MGWQLIGNFTKPQHVQPLAIAMTVLNRFLLQLRRNAHSPLDEILMALVRHHINAWLQPLISAGVILEGQFNFSVETMPPSCVDKKVMTATLSLQITKAPESYKYKFEYELNTGAVRIFALEA